MANIDTALTISGVKEYKQSIKDVVNHLGTLKTAMKVTSEEYRNNENSVEALKAKQENFRQQIAEQIKIVEQASRVQAQFRNEYGETNATTVDMTNKLNNAKAALFAMQNELDGINKKLENTQAAESAFATALDASKDAVKSGEENLKIYNSQLNVIEKQYASTGDAAEAGVKRQEVLNNAFEQSGVIVTELEKQLSYLSETVGEDSAEYRELQVNLNNARAKMDEFGTEIEKNNKELAAHSGVLQQVSDKLKIFKDSYKQGADSVSHLTGALNGAGKALTIGVTAPLVAAAAASLAAGQEINKNLANIGTLGVGNDRLMELKTGIQDIGIEAGKNTTDIANGVYSVISALGDTNDTLEITAINAKSASAGLATTQEAINLTTAVTKGYGDISAEAFQKTSDLAFQTLVMGQTTYPELAASIGKVVPTSNALKISQEELFNVFATLTGVTGNAAEVSTQYNAVLTAMMKPNADLVEVLKKQGYASGFAAIETLGLKGTMDLLVRATSGSEEALVNLMGRKEAVTAMFALTGAQSEQYTQKLYQMQNALGATDRAFAAQTEGINAAGFSFEQSMVRMQVAGQGFAEEMSPYVDGAADFVEGITGWLATLNDEQRKTLVIAAGILAAIGPTLSLTSKVITVISGLSAAHAALTAKKTAGTIATAANTAGEIADTVAKGANTVATTANTAAQLALNTAMAAAPWALVLVGIVGICTAINYLNADYERQVKKVQELSDEYQQLQNDVENTGRELETVNKRIDELNGKDAPTVIEQAELDKLYNVNKQLEVQLALQQQLASEKAKTVEQETVKLLNKTVDSYGATEGERGLLEELTLDKSVLRSIEYYDEVINKIKELENEQYKLKESGEITSSQFEDNARELTVYKDTAEQLNNRILEDGQSLLDYRDKLEGSTAEGREWAASLDVIIPLIGKHIDAVNNDAVAVQAITAATEETAVVVDTAAEALRRSVQAYTEVREQYKSGEMDSVKYITSLKEQITINQQLARENPKLADSYNRIAQTIQQELSRTPAYLTELENTSSNLIDTTDRLTAAFTEQANSSELSNKSAMDLIKSGYALALQIDEETGKITLNEQAYHDLVTAKLEDQLATLESARHTALIDKMDNERAAAALTAEGMLDLAKARLLDAKAAGDNVRDLDAQIKLLDNMKSGLNKVTVESIRQEQQTKKTGKAQNEAFSQAIKDLEERVEMEGLTTNAIIAGYEKIRDTHARTESEKLDMTKKIVELQRQEVQRYGDAATEAIKRGYEKQQEEATKYLDTLTKAEREQIEITRDGSNERVEIITDEYLQRIQQIDAVTAAQLRNCNEQIQIEYERINAIDAELAADRAAAEEKQQKERLDTLKKAIRAAETSEEQKKAKKAYQDYVDDLEQKAKEKRLNAERKELVDKIAAEQKAQDTIVEGFSKRLEAEKDLVKKFYDDLIKEAPELAAKIFAAGDTDTLNQLINQYNADWETSGAGFMEYLNQIQRADKDPLTDSATFEIDRITQNFQQVNELLAGQTEAVSTSVGTMADKSREILSKLAEDTYTLGKQSGEGIARGLEDTIPRIIAVMNTIANAAIKDTYETAHEINSPSKVMRRSARWSGLGIAAGLDDTVPDVVKSAKNLARQIQVESAALSRMAGETTNNTSQIITYHYNDRAGDNTLNMTFPNAVIGSQNDTEALSEKLMFQMQRQLAGRGYRKRL